MFIGEAISNIAAFCNQTSPGNGIDADMSRDHVLWGSTAKECTGIVTCIWASSDVIREAARRGANLIVCHEALFWNHGDHTGWLEEAHNEIFLAKRELLEQTGITVWRLHDRIHAGVPARLFGDYAVTGLGSGDPRWADGIFSGLAEELGYPRLPDLDSNVFCGMDVPGLTARELARDICAKLGLAGVRMEGDPDAVVRRAFVPIHIMGIVDNDILSQVAANDVDCLITMERTDFTVMQYLRDSCQLGRPRAAIDLGHFNVEESGMRAAARWLPEAVGAGCPQVSFVAAGDPFSYVMA